MQEVADPPPASLRHRHAPLSTSSQLSAGISTVTAASLKPEPPDQSLTHPRCVLTRLVRSFTGQRRPELNQGPEILPRADFVGESSSCVAPLKPTLQKAARHKRGRSAGACRRRRRDETGARGLMDRADGDVIKNSQTEQPGARLIMSACQSSAGSPASVSAAFL
ncbi:hypothetical protein AAFF_G00435530 [Aldrovandia affinis]|uniref:Uncharacterized protein n=1 Tax=Aldrovandia affinis TaxID=143900 RepID=A0AAD7S8H5_9TELE|nr:hypothetical protein AAFF_G00435530 [Aldrovandia affinis]